MSNAQTVYNDLTGLGLSPGAATGVVGNLVAESSVNPKAVQPGGPGRGIAQWSVGARWDQLLSWAKSKGADPWSLSTQEAFMVSEMQQDGVWAALQKISDTGTAAALVMRKYEMPANQSDSNAAHRAALGQEAVSGASSPGSGSGLSGLLSGGGGSTGTGTTTQTASWWNPLGGALDGVQNLVTKGLFVALGVGLIGIGLAKAVAPKVEQASKLAPLAAL